MDAQGRPTLDAGLLAVLDGVSVLLYVQDPDGRIRYANQAAGDLIGKRPEAIVGRMPDELFDPVTVSRWAADRGARRAERDGRRARPARRAAGAAADRGQGAGLGARGAVAGGPGRRAGARGGVAARERRGAPVGPAGGGDEIGILEFEYGPQEHAGAELEAFAATLGAQVGEFIVRRRAEEQRLHDALHDPLTGLPNRVLFFDRLDHAIRRQQREHAPLAVLFLDFDGFKAVNDRFGHAGGDKVLRLAALAVASALRAEDTVARFGGDELVVLSEHMYDRDSARGIAHRILARLRTPLPVEGEEVTLSASIGICLAPVEGRSREELLSSADRAMYRAKAAGPGRCVIAEA